MPRPNSPIVGLNHRLTNSVHYRRGRDLSVLIASGGVHSGYVEFLMKALRDCHGKVKPYA